MSWMRQRLWAFSRFLAGGKAPTRTVICAPLHFPAEELEDRLATSEFSGLLRFVPGALEGDGFSVELEVEPADASLPTRFAAAECPVVPTVGPAILAAVHEHQAVLWAAGPRFTNEEGALESARRMLLVASAIGACGVVGVLHEGAELAHATGRWRALYDRAREGFAHGGDDDEPTVDEGSAALVDAWVRRPVFDDEGWARTVGMQALGRPDVAVSTPDLDDPDEASNFLALVAAFQCRTVLVDGQGFRVAPDAPRFVMRKAPPIAPPSDPTHNPWGIWRLELDRT